MDEKRLAFFFLSSYDSVRFNRFGAGGFFICHKFALNP
jgi:hypothetical protein